ncbi:MAG: phosphopyruvate hydratase [Clostridia bacterium]|nr:phosphopyruvate hydratase [Clostridia bacterium]
MQKPIIESVWAEEILDSRGNPTVQAEVLLSDGSHGIAAAPSGASTGKYEAYELRDKEGRYGGKGVLRAVRNVNEEIAKALIGKDASCQKDIDKTLLALDGTEQKRNMGANALLAVSMATSRAAASHFKMPLWRYLGGITGQRMPVPMMNIINGGAHSANALDVQEFMIVPVGAENFAEGVRMGSEIYHTLGAMLKSAGYSVGLGDEGGYAPELSSAEEAMEWMMKAIEKAGYTDKEVKISLDIAASEWYDENGYTLKKSGARLSSEELVNLVESWVQSFPIFSVEDALSEDDWDGWRMITEEIGDDVCLVGDDLFVTNPVRLQIGMHKMCANAILIKPNQIGTVTETLDVIAMARDGGYRHILSHRSGDTEDSYIADLAVATSASFIKTGAPCRSERVSKYNRLTVIEREMGADALYGQWHSAFLP